MRRMDMLIEAVATLPPDAWAAVRARIAACGRGNFGKTEATARAWLSYHGLCMERYRDGALPEHWPEPAPQLMTMACDRMRAGGAPRAASAEACAGEPERWTERAHLGTSPQRPAATLARARDGSRA
jgi:hypothetical protein